MILKTKKIFNMPIKSARLHFKSYQNVLIIINITKITNIYTYIENIIQPVTRQKDLQDIIRI